MKKKLLLLLLCTVLLSGCTGQKSVLDIPESEEVTWTPEVVGIFEAESGTLNGTALVTGDTGYVTEFTTDGDSCDVPVEVAESGFYDLEFYIRSPYGYKENLVDIGGQNVGKIPSDNAGDFTPSTVRRVYLSSGTNTVTLRKSWGYIDFDKIKVLTSEPFDESIYEMQQMDKE